MNEHALVCLLAAAACVCTGCGPEPSGGSAGELSLGVLHGDDDRRELHQVEPDALRETLSESLGALMWVHRVRSPEAGMVRIDADPLGRALRVCEDERFVEQPAAALCSAVLIDDDLVLTAGHCLGSSDAEAADRCRRLAVVFDYHLGAGGALAVSTPAQLARCKQVVHFEKESARDRFRDLAVLQLEWSAGAERRPANTRADVPALGDPLALASHGAGLPLKVEVGAAVTAIDVEGGYLVAETDSFAGGSGAGLFNEAWELVAHQVRGEPDWVIDGACYRPLRTEESREQHQLVATSLASLCSGGWPSERLCGVKARCGDEACVWAETPDSCPSDCPAPRCGDGACAPGERSACTEDCDDFADVPPSWSGDPLLYRAGAGVMPQVSGAEAVVPGDPATGAPGGCSAGATPAPRGIACLLLVASTWLARRRTLARVRRARAAYGSGVSTTSSM